MIRITINQNRDRFQVFVAIALAILYQTNLAEYIYFAAKTVPLSPSHWVYMIYAMLLVFTGFHTEALVRAIKNPVFWWALGYLAISLLWTLGTSESTDLLELTLRERIHTVAFLIMGLIIFQSRRATYVARCASVVVVLFGVALNIWDATHPLWFTEVLGRSAGLYLNPNRSAIALLCGMVIAMGVVPQKWRGLFFLITTVGVVLTFSRAAFLAIPLVGIGLVLNGDIKGRNVTATIIGAVAVIGMYFWITGQSPDVIKRSKFWNENTMARARMDTSDISTQERIKVAKAALRMFMESPVVGNGLGASVFWKYRESSHNIYLNLMVDHGLFGAILMPLLFWFLYRRNRGALVFVFTLAYFGFYSHNLLEERFVLIPILLQAVMTQRYVETAEAVATWQVLRRRLALAMAQSRRRAEMPSNAKP